MKKKNKIIIILIILMLLLLTLFLAFKINKAKEVTFSTEEKKIYVFQGTEYTLPEVVAYNKEGKALELKRTIYKDKKEVSDISTKVIGDIYDVYYKVEGMLFVKKHIEIKIIKNPNLLRYTLEGISSEWTNKDVELTFVPNEENIAKYCVEDNCLTTKTFTVTENKKIDTYIIDSYGNKSEKNTYEVSNIDKEKPIIKEVKENIVSGKRYIAVTAEDELSGIKEYSYNGGETYSTNSSKQVTKSGTYKIKVKDSAGNESEEYEYKYVLTKATNKDTTAPTFTVTKNPNKEWSKTNVTLTINAKDNSSGVAEYSYDNGSTWQKGNTKTYESSKTVKIKVKDNAGNISESQEISVKIDKIAPVIEGVVNEEEYTREVTLTIIEENIDTKVLKKDGTTISYTGTVSETGSYSLEVTDKAGNSASIIFVIKASTTIGIVEGIADDWELVQNQTGGYTLVAFKGDLESCTNVEVLENYYTEENINPMYYNLSGNEDYTDILNKNAYKITIPNEVDGKKITELGKTLFFLINNETGTTTEPYMRIQEVIIPEGIEKINGYERDEDDDTVGAFMADINLTTVTIPSSVKTIGGSAFYLCNLSELIFKGSEDETSKLTTIGEAAFAENKITSLIIPSSVETIGEAAFQENEIETLTFAGTSKLKTIVRKAFADNKITSLIIPKSVETIGSGAFRDNYFSSLIFEGATDGTSSLKTIGGNAFDVYNVDEIIYLPSSLESTREDEGDSGGAFSCNCGESLCTFYINQTSILIPYYQFDLAGNYARIYKSNGSGGYTCVENCP